MSELTFDVPQMSPMGIIQGALIRAIAREIDLRAHEFSEGKENE